MRGKVRVGRITKILMGVGVAGMLVAGSALAATLATRTWPTFHHEVTIGDSISDGFDASSLGTTYAVSLADIVGAATWQNYNKASHCKSSAVPGISAYTGDLVVVELGTDCTSMTTTQFDSFYSAVLNQVRTTNPTATLVCLGVWGRAPVRAVMNPTISSECAAHTGTFVDTGAIFDDPSNHVAPGTVTPWGVSPNAFHPNDAGHAKIAQAIAAVLPT